MNPSKDESVAKAPVGMGADTWCVGTALFACTVIGAYLRVRGIAGQIPLDDEWHGLDFALTRDAWFLFTHFSRAGANSAPFNLCLRALLVSVGWTEITIALPSLVAGVALLWVFPRWVWRRFGAEAALVSAALLAIAPFLVFYSRTARAYSALLLLECLALIGLCDWLRDRRKRHGVALVVFGALAIWTHASALAPMLGAVAAVAFHRARLGRRTGATPALGARQVATAGLAMSALAGALWLPALLHPLPSPVHGPAHFSLGTAAGALELWSGSSHWPVQVLWALVALSGLGLAFRVAREEILLFAAAIGGGLLVVLLTRPNLAGIAGVFARYLLLVFPFVSLGIGMAVQTAARAAATTTARRYLLWAGAMALLAFLYLLGPLPRIHAAPSSFTKHPALQFSLAPDDPDRARPDPLVEAAGAGIHRSELQPFYAQLASEAGSAPVIEYPFLLGEDVNLLYFAQRVHGRPVLAGYYRSGAQDEDVFGLAVGARPARPPAHLSPGYITNAMMVDHVLGRHQPDARVRFRTVVDIEDEAAVQKSGAEYLVLHGSILRELFHIGPERVRSYFVGRIRAELIARYGAPVFENELVTVLRLSTRR